ncbi:hypothetical protein VIGAN_08033100 [Vigna angularis var. angularis]|uniref:Protein kinase domain-containing protein n=2 Tax=Phaseolus angularis TaxID=3914 RepID=A0A0S3SLR5_PHAAN|nr:LEAF RUST 10 DISEASE-RESISTANCE LOCUS RECEPTOR-LIKE PROTEIN KINASE-like 1.1 [Vigna angularis]BAT93796.1 hypothetical protein VIGAN_08033100 [Vigna angularis var. angularis]
MVVVLLLYHTKMYDVYVILLFCHLTVLLLAAGNANGHSSDCPDSFDCGSLGRFSFPFTTFEYPNCGALAIQGCNNPNKTALKQVQLTNGGKLLQVTNIVGWRRKTEVTIKDKDFVNLLESSNCSALSYNITVPPSSPFGSFYLKNNITAFNCSRQKNRNISKDFVNYTLCPSFDFYFAPSSSDQDNLRSLTSSCSMVQLPVRQDSQFFIGPFGFLTPQITFQFQFSNDCWRCQGSGGNCRIDSNAKLYCAMRKNRVSTRKLALMLGIGLGPWVIFGLFFTLRYCKQKYAQSRNTYGDSFQNPDTEIDMIFFGVPIFSYKELQEATNNFDSTRKLGDGGFGIVYHGTLRDGREVAIKHLFEHNYKRVEQFMNEIEILSRLRHRNLVSLYGCTSRHAQELLLVYEYIPNGTVASHLHGELARVGLLTWPIRMQIAIDTAAALSYLHSSNIIHRDVKTNNVLLDINFSVKVADFGLSRLFPNDVSHVSTAPQGSPGYLDPEYFQCYRLTDKSDVYSFGVVLMELISSMPAVDAARERDEVNLASFFMTKIQKGKLRELVDPSFGFESDEVVKRMVTSVAELAFRCVQGDNELRPSMDEVLEFLKKIQSGNYESENPDKGDHGGNVMSSTSREEVQPPPSVSRNSGQIEILMNNKLSSPRSFTEKWESESTTPNVSG